MTEDVGGTGLEASVQGTRRDRDWKGGKASDDLPLLLIYFLFFLGGSISVVFDHWLCYIDSVWN